MESRHLVVHRRLRNSSTNTQKNNWVREAVVEQVTASRDIPRELQKRSCERGQNQIRHTLPMRSRENTNPTAPPTYGVSLRDDEKYMCKNWN